jgi:uncharacterized protein (UPF0335 family)
MKGARFRRAGRAANRADQKARPFRAKEMEAILELYMSALNMN